MVNLYPQGQNVRMAHCGPKWNLTFLREWRDSLDISLETASAPMGLVYSQLSKIERGLHPYSQKVLEVAAGLYGCTVQDLLTRGPDEPEDIMSLWGRLNPRERRIAASMIRSMIDADDQIAS